MPLVLGLNQNCEVKIKVDTASVLNMGEKSRTEHILFCCRSLTVEVACRCLTVSNWQWIYCRSYHSPSCPQGRRHCTAAADPQSPPILPLPPLPFPSPASPQPNPASSQLLPHPKVLAQEAEEVLSKWGSTTLNVGPILPGLCVKCVVLQKLAGTHRKRWDAF